MAKMKLRQRLSRAFALPADAALPVPRIEITGRNDILLTGGALLLEFSPEIVRISRSGIEVTVRGDGLNIAAMDMKGTFITGRITCVEFDG